MSTPIKSIISELSTSESCKFFEAVCSLGEHLEKVSIFGVDVYVKPLHQLLKKADGFESIPKSIEGCIKVYDSKEFICVKTARNITKLVMDVFSILKFFEIINMSYLYSRCKVLPLSSIKTLIVLHDITTLIKGMDLNNDDSTKHQIEVGLSIVGLFCVFALNLSGINIHYFNFQPYTVKMLKLGGSASFLVKNIIHNIE